MTHILRYFALLLVLLAIATSCRTWKDLNKDREPDPRDEQKKMEHSRSQFFKSSPPPLDRPDPTE